MTHGAVNGSAGGDRGGTTEFVYEIVPGPVAALMRTCSWIIIGLNTIVLVCLVAKRSKFPRIYWLQIVCLSANDMMAGISSFLVSFVDYSPSFKNSIFGCSLVMAIFQATQLSSLFNILGIGIHRYVIIRSMESNKTTWKNRHTVLVNVVSWCTSAMLCTVPYVLWPVPEAEFYRYGGCSMETVFGTNFPKVMKVYFSGFLFPLVVTNILYTVIYISLRNKWNNRKYSLTPAETCDCPTNGRLISSPVLKDSAPAVSNIEMRELPGTSSCNGIRTVKIYDNSTTAKEGIAKQVTSNQPSGPSKKVYDTTPVRVKNIQCQPSQRIGTNEARNVNPNSTALTMKQVNDYSDPTLSASAAINVGRVRSIRHQKTAFILLCILLLLLNLFTWPAISVLFIGSLNASWRLSRALKFPVFTIIAMNSMINPVVYSIRVKEFRTIVATVTRYVCHRCLHACGFNVVAPANTASDDTLET